MTAFDVQQRLWRRYCKKKQGIINTHGYSSTITTRLLSYAWLTYRYKLRELGIVATEGGYVYKQHVKPKKKVKR